MRLLALSDVHGDVRHIADIVSSAGEVDLVLVAGDLTEFGGAAELDAVLAAFGELRLKFVAVPGNCDRKAARERLMDLSLSADGTLVERGGVLTAGVGGGALRTGLTPYERGEEELAAAMRSAIEARVGSTLAGLPLVALSHQPPKDSGADERRGAAVGSAELRAILDSVRPLLWVCGHIHESPCARRIGASLVVNPGPAKDGKYALARLERDATGTWTAEAELFVKGCLSK